MTHFVYILKCFSNGKNIYYRGFTNNINRRFLEHKSCTQKYTKRFDGNITLIYMEEIISRDNKNERKKAMKREKEIKKWSRDKVEKTIILKRRKIEALMNKHFEPFSA